MGIDALTRLNDGSSGLRIIRLDIVGLSEVCSSIANPRPASSMSIRTAPPDSLCAYGGSWLLSPEDVHEASSMTTAVAIIIDPELLCHVPRNMLNNPTGWNGTEGGGIEIKESSVLDSWAGRGRRHIVGKASADIPQMEFSASKVFMIL